MAITGMTAAIYTSNSEESSPFDSLPCVSSSPDHKRYRVSDPSAYYWDPDFPIMVEIAEDEGPFQPISTGFKLEHVGGFIIFDSPKNPASFEVRVSGASFSVEQVGGFFNWSVDFDADDVESNTFSTDGWKTFERILLGWSGSAEAFWGNTTFFEALGRKMIIQLFINKAASLDRLEGYVILSGDGIESPVDGLIEESIDFTGSGPLYIRLSEEAV